MKRKAISLIYGLVFQRAPNATSHEQRDAIANYADKHFLKIDKFIMYNEQPDITLFRRGDSVIFFAWNCICNKRTLLNSIILHFLRNNIRMYSTTCAYCIDDTTDFKQFEYAFNLYESIRFSFLSSKNVSGAKLRVANGHSPGRPFGAKNKRHVLDGKEKAILNLYSDGASMYAIAKKMKVSPTTIKRFLRAQS